MIFWVVDALRCRLECLKGPVIVKVHTTRAEHSKEPDGHSRVIVRASVSIAAMAYAVVSAPAHVRLETANRRSVDAKDGVS